MPSLPAWWDRFGTAEVKAADLYEIAMACDPPLPLGGGQEHSRRTRLGKALGKMRDRVFRCRMAAKLCTHEALWRCLTQAQ